MQATDRQRHFVIRIVSIVTAGVNLALLVTLLLMFVLSMSERRHLKRTLELAPGQANPEYAGMREAQLRELAGYSLIEGDEERFGIPMEQAMEIVVRRHSGNGD